MNTTILTIGDEIMIGQIVDSNSAWMSQELNTLGFWVHKKISVGDDRDLIFKTLDEALKETPVVLITGGLGSTKDDITKKIVADYFGTSLEFHDESLENITAIMTKLGRPVTDLIKLQCYQPKGATILPNKVGTASGIWMEKDGKIVVCMPGVPFEMQYLMKNEVLPRLKERFSTVHIVHKTIRTAGIGETDVASKIEDIENTFPQHIKLAYLPDLGQVRLRLTAKGLDLNSLEAELQLFSSKIVERMGEAVYSLEDETIESAVGKLLLQQNKKLCLAESCTGGYIAHRFTFMPGSSAYFTGSFVTYCNALKNKVLGVSDATLQTHGAVSEECVREMLHGALTVSGSDVGIAVSGIAGPDGGTPEKPVGTIWIAWGSLNHIKAYKLQLFRDRHRNIIYTTNFALNQLRRFLEKTES